MKKILITLLFLLFAGTAGAFELPQDFNMAEYVNKPYVGMNYNDAMNSELPFLLIFAKPSNAVMFAKLAPIVEMVYDEFKGQYNFCIINTKVSENKNLTKYFSPQKLPAVYLIDTQNKTYTLIEKKYYNKKAIKEILVKFKDGTLF